jgi:hypothetical protein
MSEPRACPTPEGLSRFLRGELPEPEARTLEEHLTGCNTCVETLSTLGSDDSLVEGLRGQPAIDHPSDSIVIDDLIARIKSMPEASAAPAEALTQTPVEAYDDATPGPSRDLSGLLGQSQGPGELGRLGSYRLLKVLGAGGMGIVFQAEDVTLQRLVALKVMRPALAASESGRRRFLLEARAAAAIEHDHIIAIHQVAEDRGIPYFAMPYLKGETLQQRCQRQMQLPLAEVERIGREIAEGLAAAHDRGLIHRDIKPANIWLEAGTDRVKILDFGLVCAVAGGARLTNPGTIMGTAEYMAPEQGRGQTVDHRCDLFSLGCVLYRLATGRLPFESGGDLIATLMTVATAEPASTRELRPDIPAALDDLIMQLLAKNPSSRPESARVVADLLQAQDMRTSPRDTRTVATSAQPARHVGRRRRKPALVLGLLLLVLGPAGYFCGPAVFRITTNQGEFVLECSDSDLKVQVNQQGGVTIEDTRTNNTYQLSIGQRRNLPAGDYTLTVSSTAGIEVDAKTFTIKRGRETAIKAWAVARSVAQSKPTKAWQPLPKVAAQPGLKASNPVLDFCEVHDVSDDIDAWTYQLERFDFRPVYSTAHLIKGIPHFAAIAVREARYVSWARWIQRGWNFYEAKYKELTESGMRELSCLPIRIANQTFYEGLWVEDGAPGERWPRLSAESFEELKANLNQRALRLISATVFREDGVLRFHADAAADGGLAWQEHHGLSTSQLKELLEEAKARGWRPDFLHAYEDAAGLRFLVILVANPGRVRWNFHLDLTVAQYEQELAAQKKQSMRPLAAAGFALNDVTHYAALWIDYSRGPVQARTESGEGWRMVYDANRQGYAVWEDDLRKTGYRPVSFDVHSVGGQARFAALAVKDANACPWVTEIAVHDHDLAWKLNGEEGYRAVCWSRYLDGNTLRQALLWYKDSSPWEVWFNQDYAWFQSKLAETAKEWRPRELKTNPSLKGRVTL